MLRLAPSAWFFVLVVTGLSMCASPVLANGGARPGKAAAKPAPRAEGRARAERTASRARTRAADKEKPAAATLGRRSLNDRVRRATTEGLTKRTVDAQGRTVRRLAERKRLSLADRRYMAEEAVRQRLEAEGQALGDEKGLHVYASVTDPAPSANPITGDGLIVVHARRAGADRSAKRGRERFLVHVSPGGAEVRLLARYSQTFRARLMRAVQRLRVNELAADVFASKGVREALGNFAVGGAGISAVLGASEAETLQSLTNGDLLSNVPALVFGALLVHRTVLRPAVEGVERRQVARSVDAVREAIRWAKREGAGDQGYPTLGDTYGRYVHVLRDLKSNTKALDIGEFAGALALEWNGVTIETGPGGS